MDVARKPVGQSYSLSISKFLSLLFFSWSMKTDVSTLLVTFHIAAKDLKKQVT